MKTKYTFIVGVVLLAIQLADCNTGKTFSNTNTAKPINLKGMGNNNTCTFTNTRAQRRFLAYYNYCEDLRKSYSVQNIPDSLESNNGAAASYMICTRSK